MPTVKASQKGKDTRHCIKDTGLSNACIEMTPLVFIFGSRGDDVKQGCPVLFGGWDGEGVDVDIRELGSSVRHGLFSPNTVGIGVQSDP